MSQDELVIVGKIVKAFGLNGAFKVESLSENPERFKEGNRLYIKTLRGVFSFIISSIKTHGKHYILEFENIKSKEEADLFKGKFLYVEKKDSYSKENEDWWYYHELVDLEVIDENNRRIGIVKGIQRTPLYELLEVYDYKEKESFMIPFIEKYFPKVDTKSKKIYLKNYQEIKS